MRTTNVVSKTKATLFLYSHWPAPSYLASSVLANEIEQFAKNAQGHKDQDDKFDTMMLEASEASKSNDFRLQVYEEVERYLEILMMNSENDEAKA